MIRPEVKASFWRWRELIIGILAVVIGANLYFTSFGLLKLTGAVAILFGAIAIFVGQQRGRFRITESAPGIVNLVEGQINYFTLKRAARLQ